jgi:hypothetical protein
LNIAIFGGICSKKNMENLFLSKRKCSAIKIPLLAYSNLALSPADVIEFSNKPIPHNLINLAKLGVLWACKTTQVAPQQKIIINERCKSKT